VQWVLESLLTATPAKTVVLLRRKESSHSPSVAFVRLKVLLARETQCNALFFFNIIFIGSCCLLFQYVFGLFRLLCSLGCLFFRSLGCLFFRSLGCLFFVLSVACFSFSRLLVISFSWLLLLLVAWSLGCFSIL
jgi:hypothetical protein